MTESEFCNKAIGVPWVNRGESLETGADCWGLVIESFRLIDGVTLPILSGYLDADCSTGEAAKEAEKTGLFLPSQARNGSIMCVFNTKGLITHVGRCLAGRVLHSTERMGVRWDTYRTVNTQFKNVRFYRYAAN